MKPKPRIAKKFTDLEDLKKSQIDNSLDRVSGKSAREPKRRFNGLFKAKSQWKKGIVK